MSNARAGSLTTDQLFRQVSVRGLSGKLDSIRYVKAIGRDEVEVQLGLVGNGWSTFVTCDPDERVTFE